MPATNYTKIADLYAIAKAEADAAAERVAVLRDKILESGETELNGDAFAIKVSIFEQARISTTEARKFLTDKQIAACTTVSTAHRMTIKAAVPAPAVIAARKTRKPAAQQPAFAVGIPFH